MSQNSTIHVHEDVLESDAFQIDQNASETDFGKYFQSIAENETMYSVCMVKDCSRRFSGNVESLKTHLNVAHNMIFNSTAAMCSNLNDKSADETASACDTGENVVQMQANEADVRKYFQLCQQHDGSLHSKCLIENCSHILAGNHKANLQRHAMRVHKMTFKPWSRKKLDVDAYVTAALQSSSDDSSDSDMLEMESYLPESVDVRQYFRIYHADDGKTYSECNRCKRKLAGNHKGNLMRHLIDGHHMRTNRMPGKKPRQDPRKYFQTTTIDGVLFSRCLIKDCNVRLAGNHILNLERHLKKEHSGVDEILPDTALISDETREIASSTASPLSGQKLIDGSIQQGANQDGFENENPSMQQSNCDVRKFFQRYMENDDIYNICLINRCNRRLTGNHKGNLMRHLVNAHNVNLYTMSADGPLEVAEKADSPEPAKKGTIRGLKPPVQRTPLQIPFEEIPHEITNAYEFFETIVINGKTYSQCLVNDCKRRMAGKHKGNLLRHLRNAHNMHVSRLHRHISKPRRKIKQLARDYYRLVVVNEIVYSDCMIDNCTRRLSGNHLGNLARHLVHAHKINVYGESEDGCHADESSMENFVDSFNEDSSESDPIRDDKSTAHQLPSSVSVGDLSTDHNAEDYRASDDPYQTEFPYQNEEFLFQEDEGDVDDAQDYYRTVVEDDGQIYSECLIVDCDQRMAGKDRDDLMRHLCQVHDIIIEDRRESTAIHTCRLCFEEKHDVVDVSTKNIDGMIRMHFPSQVKGRCCTFRSNNSNMIFFLHFSSAKMICCRISCAQRAGCIYQTSTNSISLPSMRKAITSRKIRKRIQRNTVLPILLQISMHLKLNRTMRICTSMMEMRNMLRRKR